MKIVTVNTPGRSYNITIGSGIISEAGSIIRKKLGLCKAAVITDDTVDRFHSSRLISSLESAGFSVIKFVLPHGEMSKSPENLIKIIEFLGNNHLTRKDAVIALGGGVVGDISGLSASLYNRGIKFIQIPTTVLGAVDSSVGGKTAVNISAGKNLMGSFYQPDAVICDYSVFDTLPKEIFNEGCAEIIKYGMICDRELLNILKNPIENIIEEIIYRCISIKGKIVEADEHDTGQRQLLNFGHTFGHAIEKCSSYSIPHGNAVAIGMAIISYACINKGICNSKSGEELINLLRLFNLPYKTDYSPDELFEALLSDKKRKGNEITLVIPENAGKCVLKTMEITQVRDYLNEGLSAIGRIE